MFFSLITQEEPGKEVKAVPQRVTLATYEIIQHETSIIALYLSSHMIWVQAISTINNHQVKLWLCPTTILNIYIFCENI